MTIFFNQKQFFTFNSIFYNEKNNYQVWSYFRRHCRGLSINSKIIEYLKNWCISQNIFEMRLDVYDTNQSAVKAYEKFGFKKDMVNMRMQIK